ncbi:MAG: hypothetical protein AB1778_03310 [Candidatus Bipolaricaulota bacterium]
MIERLDRQLEHHASAVEEAISRHGLPLHIVFAEEIEANATRFLDVGRRLYPQTSVLFAVKSNPCRGALRVAAQLGLGADAASEHELQAALEEGIPPERIVCNGNAKTSRYLEAIVRCGSLCAVDNADELAELSRIAARRGERVPVLARFRGMPLSGFTADDQTTASEWTKFGFPLSTADEVFATMRAAPGVSLEGISAHIGTQIADPAAYELLVDHFLALAHRAAARGQPFSIIDLGGGYPVAFLEQAPWAAFTARLWSRLAGRGATGAPVTWNDLAMGYAGAKPGDEAPRWEGKAYWSSFPGAAMLEHALIHRDAEGRSTVERLRALGSPRLLVEPGRSLLATAGVTLADVRGTKDVLGNPVVSLDLGIVNHGTNLITPDLFAAAVLPRHPDDRPFEAFLAGRLCFSGDMISKAKVPLNRAPSVGERVVIYGTGAYSADHFASNSCGFPLPAKVAIDRHGRAEVWRRAQTFADVFGPLDGRDAAPVG